MKSVSVFVAACLGVSVAAAPADLIYNKASCRKGVLHADDTARRVGDVLTIIIEEHSVIDNETNRNLDKSSERKASTDGTLDLANILWPIGKHIFDFPKLSLDSSAGSKFDGKSTYDTERKVADKITVTVHDVLPNGNLVVMGARGRGIAGDKQTVLVSGIVRPSDISFANTVQSGLVAEFQVRYADGAREERFVKPGWLARIFNALNPF
jgi:flagellar L-ring protein precursor FlgH